MKIKEEKMEEKSVTEESKKWINDNHNYIYISIYIYIYQYIYLCIICIINKICAKNYAGVCVFQRYYNIL